jgi:hypothetical protein
MLIGSNASDSDWTEMRQARKWMQRQVASYGAAIAIILEQLNAYPRSTITDNPNPLVRIRDEDLATGDWHPDELLTLRTGRQYVLIWDHHSNSIERSTISSN